MYGNRTKRSTSDDTRPSAVTKAPGKFQMEIAVCGPGATIFVGDLFDLRVYTSSVD
jgi:hypothetical protein